MNHHQCSICHQPIENGLAVIRSESFQRVAYCRPCWRVTHPLPIPGQRTPADAQAVKA